MLIFVNRGLYRRVVSAPPGSICNLENVIQLKNYRRVWPYLTPMDLYRRNFEQQVVFCSTAKMTGIESLLVSNSLVLYWSINGDDCAMLFWLQRSQSHREKHRQYNQGSESPEMNESLYSESFSPTKCERVSALYPQSYRPNTQYPILRHQIICQNLTVLFLYTLHSTFRLPAAARRS